MERAEARTKKVRILAINTTEKIEVLLISLATFPANFDVFSDFGDLDIVSAKEQSSVEGYFCAADKTLAGSQLIPQINTMLSGLNLTLADIDAFACVIGPGSFTGIRIAVSTVRAFAYALKKPVIPVTLFDVLAYNKSGQFSVCVDGGAGAAYLKDYGAGNGEPRCVRASEIGANALEMVVADSFFSPFVTEKSEDGAERLAMAVLQAVMDKKTTDFEQLMPLYLRKSQPERQAGDI